MMFPLFLQKNLVSDSKRNDSCVVILTKDSEDIQVQHL